MVKTFFLALFLIVLVTVSAMFLPWNQVNWGKISILPAATITVTGSSQSEVANQIATFNATIVSTNDDKQKAIDDVNTKMTALITSIKAFGVADADIKTQQINAYQQPQPQTLIYPPVPSQAGTGAWYASNTIEVKLRDVAKASGLADIINKSGASNIYGPNLTLDTSTQNASDLLTNAVADAKKNAESIAKASGVTLGRVINVQENGSSYPVYALDAKVSSASPTTPVQPGTSTLAKSVTVTFEIR